MALTRLARSLALAIVFILAAGASAQTFPAGGGAFSGRGTIKVSRCGKAAGSGSVTYSLDAAGVFMELGSGYTIVGAAAPMGKRSFSISYDATNTDIINGFLANGASSACQDAFTLTASQITNTLKLNKRATRAKVTSTARIEGTTSSGAHTGKFKAKDNGNWTLAP
jgi:S-adenosylmethionine synthetase